VDRHHRHRRLPADEGLPGLQDHLGLTRAVDEDPVGAPEIVDDDLAVGQADLRVASGRLSITEDDVTLISADRDHRR
jgi:hypothetical protein